VDAGNPDEALGLLVGIPFEHFRALRADALLIRVRCHAQIGNFDALETNLLLLLHEHGVAPSKLRNLVEACQRDGRNDAALLVAREVVRVSPEAHWAQTKVDEIAAQLRSEAPRSTR
jgi:hypothetical protein